MPSSSRPPSAMHWHRWFAWRPVIVYNRAGKLRVVWLQYVERRWSLGVTSGLGPWWVYRRVRAFAEIQNGAQKRGRQTKAASSIFGPPSPLSPSSRGIEILPRIVCTQGPIRYGKLIFLDCCKFATTGAFLQRIVVSSLLSAHHYSIRPKVGRPSPSPDTPWLLHL